MIIRLLDISPRENVKYILEQYPEINACEDGGAEIVSVSWTKTDNKFILRFPNLKAIVNRSMGQDKIDMPLLVHNNIKLYQIGDYCSISIAQYIINAIANTTDCNKPTKVLIFGYGRVGKQLHDMCLQNNYKCVIVHHDSLLMEYISILPTITHIAIVSPLSTETQGWLSSDKINYLNMATIINASRGKIVDTIALIKGISNHNIKNAILDVVSNNKIIRGNKNIKYTNHSAWCSPESKIVRAQMTCDLIKKALSECTTR